MLAATFLAMAVPSLAVPCDKFPPPYGKDTFSLLMTIGTGTAVQVIPLSVLKDTTQEASYLVGQGPAVPAYFTSDDKNKLSLQLHVSGVDYGVDVPDIGNLQNVAEAVTASPGYQEYEFQVVGGNIYHDLSAGSNVWLACERVLNGQALPVLAWGSMAPDGSVPRECSVTSVQQGPSLNKTQT